MVELCMLYDCCTLQRWNVLNISSLTSTSRLEMMTLRQFAITVVIFLPDHENIYQQSIPPVAVETRDKCSLSGFKFKVSCRNKEYP